MHGWYPPHTAAHATSVASGETTNATRRRARRRAGVVAAERSSGPGEPPPEAFLGAHRARRRARARRCARPRSRRRSRRRADAEERRTTRTTTGGRACAGEFFSRLILSGFARVARLNSSRRPDSRSSASVSHCAPGAGWFARHAPLLERGASSRVPPARPHPARSRLIPLPRARRPVAPRSRRRRARRVLTVAPSETDARAWGALAHRRLLLPPAPLPPPRVADGRLRDGVRGRPRGRPRPGGGARVPGRRRRRRPGRRGGVLLRLPRADSRGVSGRLPPPPLARARRRAPRRGGGARGGRRRGRVRGRVRRGKPG